jgi:hypothetical protein
MEDRTLWIINIYKIVLENGEKNIRLHAARNYWRRELW